MHNLTIIVMCSLFTNSTNRV